jgi:hypothetical protein
LVLDSELSSFLQQRDDDISQWILKIDEHIIGKPFSQLIITSAVGREVGSHNGWSYDQSKDRPTSLLSCLQIMIKKDYVVFIILYVKKVDKTFSLIWISIPSYYEFQMLPV